jgi:hypothetical protein
MTCIIWLTKCYYDGGVKMILAALDLNLEIKGENIVLDPRSPNSAPSEDIPVAEARIVAAKSLGIQKPTWQEFGDWMRGRRT